MISLKASGGSKETKLDYTFRRLGLDRKYIDLASADQGQVFYLGCFFFSCFFALLWRMFLKLKENMKVKDIRKEM